jgi:hypothetical protein
MLSDKISLRNSHYLFPICNGVTDSLRMPAVALNDR